MTIFPNTRRLASNGISTGIVLALLGACSALGPPQTAQPAFYSLDSAPLQARRDSPRRSAPAAPTLIVNPPRAAAGFDGQRIVYVRTAHQLEYYAHSEWIDPPARMIAPLIVAALETGGSFGAVVATPSVASGDLRLDTELVRLQHDLATSPSRVRLTLRVYLLDNTTRAVLAWREFDESIAVSSETPYGAVVAANQAMHAVLGKLTDFCADAVGTWKPAQ